MDIYTRKLRVEYSESEQALLIINPIIEQQGLQSIKISKDTLKAMTLDEAAAFVGERILLVIPEMREIFKTYFWQGPEPLNISEENR